MREHIGSVRPNDNATRGWRKGQFRRTLMLVRDEWTVLDERLSDLTQLTKRAGDTALPLDPASVELELAQLAEYADRLGELIDELEVGP